MVKRALHSMMIFMSNRMIACDEASYLISYKSDHRLGFKKWWSLKIHLLTCHLCRKYNHQIEQLNLAVKRYSDNCAAGTCSHHLSTKTSIKIQQAVTHELNAN